MRNEEKRNKLQEQKDRERKETNESNNDASREKLTKIKEVNDGIINGKVSVTLLLVSISSTHLTCQRFQLKTDLRHLLNGLVLIGEQDAGGAAAKGGARPPGARESQGGTAEAPVHQGHPVSATVSQSVNTTQHASCNGLNAQN